MTEDNHNILDAPVSQEKDYRIHLKGFKFYVPLMFLFVLIPTIIMNKFSPHGFTEFMNFPNVDFSRVTVFGMFGIAGVLLLFILYRLFKYSRAKKRANN